jgi:heme oxygenase
MPPTRPVLRFYRSSFHERLREATGALHHRVEAQLPLLDRGLTSARYREVLRAFFGFYVPLESTLETSAPTALRLDAACRRKSWWLVEDLLSLGDSPHAIGTLPFCSEMPPMTNQADVLGVLYVVEGATLGGQFVLQSLRRSLGQNADQSVRFFTSYGTRVPDMWSSFLRILEAAAYDEVQEQAIIASACRTFASFEQWLRLQLVDEQSAAGRHRQNSPRPPTVRDLVFNAS